MNGLELARRYRTALVTVVCASSLATPWTDLGADWINVGAPLTLGALIACLFPERRPRARCLLTAAVVGAVAVARLLYQAVVLDGGDFSFDGDLDLEAIGIVLHVGVGTWGCAIALMVRAERHGKRGPGATPQ